MATSFRIALVQMMVTSSKRENLSKAETKIKEAVRNGANVVVLPECFNSPYGTQYFPIYAENIPGPSSEMHSRVAKDNHIWLIGGSIPESSGEKIYNTCTVYNPDGQLVTKHRKVHLVDIDIPGKIKFREADTLSPGDLLTTFETSFCKIGLGICYDMRFAEMAQIYGSAGCKMVIYPGCFNMTTGPVHWELLLRARAVDNQVYVAGVSTARDEMASYITWGHSSIVGPWGDVIATTGHYEDIVYADIDLDNLIKVREQIPMCRQRRDDLYTVEDKTVTET